MAGKWPSLIARVLLGLVFFASGLVGLFQLVPPPPDLPERLQVFNAGLMASGYFMTLLKLTETICGLFLLSGFFVPLAPSGVPLAIVLGLLLIYLSFFSKYSPPIRRLFQMR